MSDNLRQKTTKGLVWNGIHNFSMKGIQFFLMLFMARLLSPEDYGIVGLVYVFIAIASVLAESGFSTALIRKKDRTKTDLSTVFFFNIAISFLCYVIIYLIAPWVSQFYDIPILTPVIRVLALTLVFSSFNIVQVAIMNYTMNFRKQALISITHTLVAGLIGLVLAFMGCGVWALVFQSICQSVMGMVLCWTLCNWRPSFVFSKASFQELFGFSSKLLMTRLIDSIYNNIYPVIIGKNFSANALGHYSRAYHWASFPSTNLVSILQNVTFASLSKIQEEDERLCCIYRKMIKTSAFIIFPLMIGLAVVAKPLIYVTIGDKWDFCAQILQIICFVYMLQPILGLNINLLQVKGRSDLSLKLSVIEKFIAIVVLFVSIPLGLLAMCGFGVLTSFLMLLLNTYYTSNILNIGILRQLKDLLPSFLLSIVMGVSICIIVQYINDYLLKLCMGMAIGIIIYIGLAHLFKIEELKECNLIVKGIFHKH